jgi:hypothetical protein
MGEPSTEAVMACKIGGEIGTVAGTSLGQVAWL